MAVLTSGGNPQLEAATSTSTNGPGGGSPSAGDDHALRATASFDLPAGRYTLSTLSDDGVRVLVDDKVLFENWTWHHTTEDAGSIQLTGGVHKVVVEYFEINGAATLTFQITPETEPAPPSLREPSAKQTKNSLIAPGD